MGKRYKKPFLKKVIARIDFTSKINVPMKGLSKKASELILQYFPIPEPKEIKIKHLQILDSGAKEIIEKQNNLIYHSKNKGKLINITPDFAFLEIQKYETSEILNKDFDLLLEVLSIDCEYSIKRFGLRFINQIELDEQNPFDWSKYLKPELLSGFNIVENPITLSRLFTSLVQSFDDSMLLHFQYGMYNPDYPSRIRKKLFILDFDAFLQGVFEKEYIKDEFSIAHQRIEECFENLIRQELRNKMEEINE